MSSQKTLSGAQEWSTTGTLFEPSLSVSAVNARLRLIINACFDNFRTKLSVLRIASQEGHQFEESITFQEFYHIVYQAFKLDLILPYEIYSSCARGWFVQFGQLLSKRLGSEKEDSTAAFGIGQGLINYWNQIQNNVLPYIGQAFMGIEQVMVNNRCRRMLLIELTAHLFYTSVIESQPVVQSYLKQAIHGTIQKGYRQILEGLTKGHSVSELKTTVTKQEADQLHLCLGLINMLGQLDSKYQNLLVQAPLLRHTLPDFLHGTNFRPTDKIPAYCEIAAQFIKLQHWLHEQLLLTETTATSRLCRHLLFCRQLPVIIEHKTSGVKLLLEKRQFTQLAQIAQVIQDQLEGGEACQDASTNVKQHLLDFFKSHFECESSVISANFPVASRRQSLEFVCKILTEREHWKALTEQCFTSHHFKSAIESTVNWCLQEILRISKNSAHALAYYLHDLMLRDSVTLEKYNNPPLPKNFHRERLIHELVQGHVCNLGREINLFYDYTKHYFVRRLMCHSGAVKPEEELSTLEFLNNTINFRYVKLRDGSQPMLFSQNLNDFKLIYGEYKKLFEKNSTTSSGRKFLDHLDAMHAGIFKHIDFEQCVIGPSKLVRSFRDAKRTFERRNAQKKVILNTRYSAALLTCLWVEPRPVEVWVNLNQMAIVGVFESRDIADYRTIQQETQFRKEYYLQLSILSLIYAGLLEVSTTRKRSPSLENLRFRLSARFNPKEKTDLRHLDEVDYDSVQQPTCELFKIAVQLITNGVDLYFRCAEMLIQELDLNHILSAPSSPNITSNRATESSGPGNGRFSSFGTNLTTPELLNSRTRVTRRMTRDLSALNNNNQNKSNSSLGSSPVVGPRPSLGPCIEREIKIEAAMVRLLKSHQSLPNLRAIHAKLEPMIARFLPPNDDQEQPESLTMDEVQRVLLKLIEKKYVQRGPTGAFCYILS